jgi:SAM-dependent methyltransferase
MLTGDLLAYVRAALPPPPARVLEVGAGRGELALALRDAGYEMTAVDPAAEPDGIVRQCSLLDVGGSFDAAVAVVSLHHLDPLQESCNHLATLLPAEGRLVIDEIDIDRHDERAIRWWQAQREALGFEGEQRDAAEIIDELRRHVHPLEKVCAALAPHFEFGLPVRGPYLHRWELRSSLRELEVDLIAEGLLPAVGARLVATRTTG